MILVGVTVHFQRLVLVIASSALVLSHTSSIANHNIVSILTNTHSHQKTKRISYAGYVRYQPILDFEILLAVWLKDHQFS